MHHVFGRQWPVKLVKAVCRFAVVIVPSLVVFFLSRAVLARGDGGGGGDGVQLWSTSQTKSTQSTHTHSSLVLTSMAHSYHRRKATDRRVSQKMNEKSPHHGPVNTNSRHNHNRNYM